MKNKVLINIVNRELGPTTKVYENEFGAVWTGKNRLPRTHNISSGSLSILNPNPKDSLLLLEPFCVTPFEYDVNLINKYKYIFTWNTAAFKSLNLPNLIEINNPSRRKPFETDFDCLPWKERKNEVVFIANDKHSSHPSELYTLRTDLADYFHREGSFKVSWYGFSPMPKQYYLGPVESKLEILSKVKFTICTENCYDSIYSHNYFTEKIPETIGSGAVPLYMGCYNIDDFEFDKDSYIDLRSFMLESENGFKMDLRGIVKKMKRYDEQQYSKFKEGVIYNITKEKGMYHVTSYQRMYETIIDTFRKIEKGR